MPIDPLLQGGANSSIDQLLAWSLRNKFLVLIFVFIAGVFGIRSVTQLPIDAVPDVTNVQVQILTEAPGLGPEDVEGFLTVPVEQAMGGVPHVEEMRSLSRFGLSVVTVVFEEGTDIWWARQVLGERLIEAREAIPAGYGTPELGPVS
ncbi:MAG TPA: efflux RND transporter permease subunit, partial [Myxococcota bacterium]|nr:efflux RND transporter permease subunit [Myxococcota bacterium]